MWNLRVVQVFNAVALALAIAIVVMQLFGMVPHQLMRDVLMLMVSISVFKLDKDAWSEFDEDNG